MTMAILKVTQSQSFILSLEGRFWERPHGCQIDPPTGILELSTKFFLTI